jgi:signal transduction histidine kinase
MSRQASNRLAPTTIEDEKSALVARLSEIHSLSAEIVELFYTQTFSPSAISTPPDVCTAFSNMLRRHWELCCIVTYLCDDDGRLREMAVHIDENVDEEKAREMSRLFSSAVEERKSELQVWLDEESEVAGDKKRARLRRALKDVGAGACIAIPIYAQSKLIGVLVAATAEPQNLREALNGIRFVAAPIVIAIGNASREAEMREQHRRIEQLVHELQQQSRDLAEANRELRRVAHYRSLFLARMSHELRTPLTSMLGFAEILLDSKEPLSDSQRRYCDKIQSSGMQLQTSLNQLVDLSRLEAGQTELFLHEFSLRETLRESCAAVTRLAQKRSVKLDCVSAQDLPTIVSDEGKLRQVLYNFLAHAINRSPEDASVIVRAEKRAPCRFYLMIEDTGERIEDISHIFDPVDIEAPSEHPTGMNELGLVISRRLIDVLGGTVKLETPKPHGLKVTIELPGRPMETKSSDE